MSEGDKRGKGGNPLRSVYKPEIKATDGSIVRQWHVLYNTYSQEDSDEVDFESEVPLTAGNTAETKSSCSQAQSESDNNTTENNAGTNTETESETETAEELDRSAQQAALSTAAPKSLLEFIYANIRKGHHGKPRRTEID